MEAKSRRRRESIRFDDSPLPEPTPIRKLRLSPREVAEELGLSEKVVLADIKAGAIPSHKSGRNHIVYRQELDEWRRGSVSRRESDLRAQLERLIEDAERIARELTALKERL